ncbi:BnaCnng39090D [Brassica napus]|uniref:BnaCnng39090D protein n=1 Tax=Brassica napus TaxID=3708 RepID=A0A078J975_BRANA|nr:BnaCnng39090D [Brassica napus]
MSNVLVHSGVESQHTMRPVRRLHSVKREKQPTASIVGTRSMILFPSLVDHVKLQQERRQAAKMRLMFSIMLTPSTTIATKRSSRLNMRGESFAMTRNGVAISTAMKAATKG